MFDLYDEIKNPLDDDDVLRKILEAYSSDRDFYVGLTHNSPKRNERKSGRGYYKFYIDNFNKWKNSIINMSREDYTSGYKKGYYRGDLIKLRKYLKTIPDAKTLDDVKAILYGRNDDKELQDAIDKYSWQSLGEGSGWEHVASTYFTARRDPFPNIEHRLYANIGDVNLFHFCNLFMEKCEEKGLPYYYKIDDGLSNRDDSFVLYCSSEDLSKFIDIFR